jgi:hypothetical protein
MTQDDLQIDVVDARCERDFVIIRVRISGAEYDVRAFKPGDWNTSAPSAARGAKPGFDDVHRQRAVAAAAAWARDSAHDEELKALFVQAETFKKSEQ